MNISRRNFIKAGVAGSTTLGLSGMFTSRKWFQSAAAENAPNEVTRFTYHTTNCGGRCAFKCTVRDGKFVKIVPNNWTDTRFSTVCLKGLSEIERIYSPDRLKTPLKRVGKRGEGKFVAISWDEALTEIHKKLSNSVNKYGSKSILFSASSGIEYTYQPLVTLLGAQYVCEAGIDVGLANGLEECIGGQAYGYVQNETSDWVNSKTIIFLGCNILETTLTDSKFFYAAKNAGAKIITIDPNYSTTASKSDQWISIRPGTDGDLLLGMVTLILEKNWYDAEYLTKNTSSPFLVREDNKQLLRVDQSKEGNEENPFYVWDENSNSLMPYNAKGVKPQLEGEFTVDGVKVKTVFTALKENQKPYTLSWTSQKTEIEEVVIYELTKRYATAGPAVLGWGFGGIDKWTNADVAGHAGAILGALTGNIGRAGGAVGNALYHGTSWSAALNSWELPPQFAQTPLEMTTQDMRIKENSVRVVINLGNTLQQHFANLSKTEEWINSLDFLVTIDPFHNPSVNYSDIVLPASTAFESEYDIINMQVNRSHVLLSQRVIKPLHESKSDFQIEKEIAARFGLDHHLPKTPEDLQRHRLNSGDPRLEGITIEALRENNFIMRLKVPNEPYRGFTDQKYLTPSTKLEIYHEKMAQFDQALPNSDLPSEANENSSLAKKYPLQFSQAHTRYRVHSQFTNSRWINQIDPGPKLEINSKDAESRKLKTGDLVEIFNDRGSFQAKCKITEYLRPGQVRLHEGWWTEHMKAGNLQNVTNDTLNERQYLLRYGPVIPYNDTLVEVKKI
ncbi:molybdopterin-dependent oxidoreductase [Bacillus sp. DTU_2020_1000418_1_SI_GHA_SEK_038]|uniref:molybdopterin-dependent oxidoreductase n=1 Tax=Bacillus sp. DTU_2020_1000418_1_SI_GHA_SEK_038 TaxID=3077585 RepID=UPI0028E3ECD3|nr:molybdopterin-dependent oxidoreductase [Bacillus sp. DTU_2020_1000418_1_SI_GHA_SEK_038]WNS75960.1 molybdopterin-dependent oxidoreductase [Bacillus sp. DTU_2020_1000418_1_SI_GHA_SEK_038]